jgi:hypothetical protein
MFLELQYIESQYCVTNSDNHWWRRMEKHLRGISKVDPLLDIALDYMEDEGVPRTKMCPNGLEKWHVAVNGASKGYFKPLLNRMDSDIGR